MSNGVASAGNGDAAVDLPPSNVWKDTQSCMLDTAIEAIGQTPLVHLHKICADLPAQIGK